MTHTQSRRPGRSAFTLIELLVVIAIIAILVSLTAAAVMRALWLGPDVKTGAEIGELGSALASFQQDFGLGSTPPPSYLVLYEDLSQYASSNVPGALQSFQFLKRAFGKNLGFNGTNFNGPIDWNGDGALDGPTGANTPWILEGEQCLVFYTGGIPNPGASPPQPRGFSTNSANPANFTSGRTYGPYMQFDGSRLIAGAGGFCAYIDAWNVKGSPKPYAYFSSYGINNKYNPFTGSLPSPLSTSIAGDCPSIGAFAYLTSGGFTNGNGYQIISAGQDGVFGASGTSASTGNVLWNPSTGATGTGKDDRANFSNKILGAGQ